MNRINIMFPSTTTLLGIVFVVLQLCNVINWPWIWVLCPFWIPIAIALVGLIMMIVFLGVVILYTLAFSK